MKEWYDQRSEMPLPGFLTAMLVGIVLTNGRDFFKIELHKPSISLCGDVNLQLFLAMRRDYGAAVIAAGFSGLGLGNNTGRHCQYARRDREIWSIAEGCKQRPV